MDTEFTALPARGSLARTDQMVVAADGVPYRTTFPLPIIAGDGSTTILANSSTPFGVFRDVDVVTSGAAGAYLSLGARVGAALTEAVQIAPILHDANTGSLGVNIRKAGAMTSVARFSATGLAVGGTGIGGRINFCRALDGAVVAGMYWGPEPSTGPLTIENSNAGPIAFKSDAATEVGRFDASGNLLVGVATGTAHTIRKAGSEGSYVAFISSAAAGATARFMAVASDGFNAANAAVFIGKNSSTNRSVNAGGTINASGSDYAEYLKKAIAHLAIELLKGEVVGIDADGHITPKWSEAHSFVIKSYDPSIVGGDTWTSHLKRPTEPVLELPEYEGPSEPQEPDPLYTLHLVAWHEAQAKHVAAVAAAEAAHSSAMAAHAADLAAFKNAVEQARATVDRIAFSGQVPVIVTGPYAPGQYLVAEEGPDDKILCRAWSKADLIADRMAGGDVDFRKVGKVWANRSVQLDPADEGEDPEMVSRAWAVVLHS